MVLGRTSQRSGRPYKKGYNSSRHYARRSEITIFKDLVRIDVQTYTPGITFEEAWKRRTVMNCQGQDFFIVSKEDLINSKRSAGRPVDLSDVALLTLDKDKEKKGGE
jgi:hypothetical protein